MFRHPCVAGGHPRRPHARSVRLQPRGTPPRERSSPREIAQHRPGPPAPHPDRRDGGSAPDRSPPVRRPPGPVISGPSINPGGPMDIDPVAVGGALALTLLAVLLTGPGLWSEKWGWWWLRARRERSGREEPPARPR